MVEVNKSWSLALALLLPGHLFTHSRAQEETRHIAVHSHGGTKACGGSDKSIYIYLQVTREVLNSGPAVGRVDNLTYSGWLARRGWPKIPMMIPMMTRVIVLLGPASCCRRGGGGGRGRIGGQRERHTQEEQTNNAFKIQVQSCPTPILPPPQGQV